MFKTLRLLAITASFGAVIIVGCGDDSKDGGTNLPPRNTGTNKDGGETNTSSSSSGGATDDSGSGYDCSKHAPVSDTPACDQCTRAKCCEWITKCDGSPSCKATQDCIAACANDDTACILTCSATAGTGGTFLEELGACASNNCKAECPSQSVDGGFDGF